MWHAASYALIYAGSKIPGISGCNFYQVTTHPLWRSRMQDFDFEDEIEAAVIENDDQSDDSKGGSNFLSSIIRLLLVCGIGYAIFIWLF